MAKQTSNNDVVDTTKAPSIRDELINLAVEYTVSEHINQMREEIKKQQGGKYQATFEVAKRCTGLAQFREVTDAVKAHMKTAGQNIDRTYSNAVSAIKRYWTIWVEYEGMEVKVDKKGNKLTLRKSIKDVQTFNLLKSGAEGAKKALETKGSLSTQSLRDKWAALDVKLRHADEKTAAAAIDAALAFFLAGGKPTKVSGKGSTKAKGASAKQVQDATKDKPVVLPSPSTTANRAQA